MRLRLKSLTDEEPDVPLMYDTERYEPDNHEPTSVFVDVYGAIEATQTVEPKGVMLDREFLVEDVEISEVQLGDNLNGDSE